MHDSAPKPDRLPNWRGLYLVFAAAVLLAPAIGMQLTRQVRWGAEDFGVAAFLLIVLWMGVELVMRVISGPIAKTAAISGLAAIMVVIWAHLAVGLF